MNVARRDYPRQAFPIVVEMWGPDRNPFRGDEPSWSATLQQPQPGAQLALQVPGLGWPTWTRESWADNTFHWFPPPPEPPGLPAQLRGDHDAAREWFEAQKHAYVPGPQGACEHRMSDGAICGARMPDAYLHRT